MGDDEKGNEDERDKDDTSNDERRDIINDQKERIKESLIYSDILGSDHCPIGLEME